MLLLGVMAGGALGALCRYLVTIAMQAQLAGSPYASFPLGTLTVNVVGSFLLAFTVTLGLHGHIPPALRVAIGSGFLGAMTTFSTFELEADGLLRLGEQGRALLYVLANLVLGYLAILLGRAAAEPLVALR